MNLLFLLIFTIFVTNCHSYNILDPESRPLLSFLVGTAPPSDCIMSCTEPLRQPLADFVNHEINIKTKDRICRAYVETKRCMANNDECIESDQQVVEKLTYGLSWACGEHGYDPFEFINPCIVTLGKHVRRERNCTEECRVRIDENSTEIMNPESPNLIGRMENTCEPLACFLNCTAKQMNSYCPTGGSRLIHVAASALDELVEEFKRATPTEQKYILQLVPDKCEMFFNEREIMRLRFDEQFVNDMFFMITSRRQRSRQTAKTEAERIVNELVQRMEEDMATPSPLVWDVQAVVICAAIIAVMLVNVVGLVFTVWWCLTSKEDNGEGGVGDDVTVNQFVEPNIRMKLKLPKLRSDAIHDISQEIQLRVPRNGNQYHQDEDEQTVVVSCNKRRRTYSVPLEPRPRTQSTGSDRFPQIVIVRNSES